MWEKSVSFSRSIAPPCTLMPAGRWRSKEWNAPRAIPSADSAPDRPGAWTSPADIARVTAPCIIRSRYPTDCCLGA